MADLSGRHRPQTRMEAQKPVGRDRCAAAPLSEVLGIWSLGAASPPELDNVTILRFVEHVLGALGVEDVTTNWRIRGVALAPRSPW